MVVSWCGGRDCAGVHECAIQGWRACAPAPSATGDGQPAAAHGAGAQRGAHAARRDALPRRCLHVAAHVGCAALCNVQAAALLRRLPLDNLTAPHGSLAVVLLRSLRRAALPADAVPEYNLFGLQRLFNDLGGIRWAGAGCRRAAAGHDSVA